MLFQRSIICFLLCGGGWRRPLGFTKSRHSNQYNLKKTPISGSSRAGRFCLSMLISFASWRRSRVIALLERIFVSVGYRCFAVTRLSLATHCPTCFRCGSHASSMNGCVSILNGLFDRWSSATIFFPDEMTHAEK